MTAPSLHLITSRSRLAPDARTTSQQLQALDQQIDEAVDASVDVIQVRERDLEAGVLLSFVSRVMARVPGRRTRVIVSERVDVAVVAGAAGVHLPSSGMPADRVRAIAPGTIIGRSIHAGDLPADRLACDYLLFGTVFVSESKGPASPVAGIEGLAAAVRVTGRPVVAIGGITPDRAPSCLEAGAAGVAAIGAFLPPGRARGAMGVRAAVAAFRASLARER